MFEYVASVMDAEGSEIEFDCQADDLAHAIEQADNAYPGCVVVSAALVANPWFVIVGGIPGGLSVVMAIKAKARQRAMELFEESVYEDEDDPEVKRESVFREHGLSVFIDSVSWSYTRPRGKFNDVIVDDVDHSTV